MSTPLWQHPRMASLEDGALRPGGLALTRKVYDRLAVSPTMHILDAGCGTGATGEFLQQQYGVRVTGLDLSPQNTALTTARHIPAVQGTIEHLPFSDASFHMVNCDCVLSLCTSIETTIAEFSRVIRPDGMLVLSDLYRRAGYRTQPCGTNSSPAATENTTQKIHTAASCHPHTNTHTGGCSSAPVDVQRLTAALAATGFAHIDSIDCTKELKELTAKLIFSGIAPCCPAAHAEQASNATPQYDKHIGYIHLTAVKKE